MFKDKSGLLLVAALGLFVLAVLSSVLLGALMVRERPEATVEQIAEQNSNLMYQFEDLAYRYPDPFAQYFGTPSTETLAEALRLGRRVYVSEGCWHCHSQLVRPGSRDEDRWGPASTAGEFRNELRWPAMFGSRRIGPDLSREGGRHGNDWHAVHFYRPRLVSTGSPMPDYPWLFDGAPDRPNRRGLALITYVQWLGSWLESYPYYEAYEPIRRPENE